MTRRERFGCRPGAPGLAGAAALCLALCTLGAPAHAEQGPLTLHDVLGSVERSYPKVIAALAEQSAARASLGAARGGFDPVLQAGTLVEPVGGYPKQTADVTVTQPTPLWGTSVFAGYRIGAGDYASYEGKLETLDAGEVRGGLRVPLLRDGPIDSRRAGIRTATIDQDMAGLSVEEQQIEARRAASLRYWEWVAAGQRVQVVRDWLNLAVVRDQALAERVARGEIAEFERVENQRTMLQRESALVTAQRDVRQAAQDLALFVRDENGDMRVPSPEELPAALPDPLEAAVLVEDPEHQALVRRPDVRRMELQYARGEVAEALASNQRLPELRFEAVGSQDLGTGDPSKVDPVVELRLLLEIPLLNRTARGRTQAARAGLRRIDAQAQLVRDQAVSEVRIALLGLDAARVRADLTARELQVARTLASGELERFNLGESTLLLVNLREQASAEAELRHVDVLSEYHRMHAVLRAAVARNGSEASR